MLGPTSYITAENGSKMKQKLNISNTNPRGKIKKKMLGMNRTGYWLTLQTHRYCGQSLQLHVWEPKPQQRKTSLGEESVRGKVSYNASREMTNLKWKNILKKTLREAE